jgi:hypothetical protein
MEIDPRGFGISIWLLIGALLALGVLFGVILGIWTLVKYLLWQKTLRRAGKERHAERFHADGRPKAPTGAGVCELCRRSYREVHHLADGRRLCPAHYAAETDA